jgi:hypothetical protein
LLPAEDYVANVWNEFNQNGVVMVEPSPGLETSDSREARMEREKEEAKDVALNRSLVRKGYYWLDGRWVGKGEVLEAPRSETVDVVGPVCESGDFLGHDRELAVQRFQKDAKTRLLIGNIKAAEVSRMSHSHAVHLDFRSHSLLIG